MAITISGDSPNITTLALTTLSDGTNSTSSTNCIQGSAKAWVNFNASSGTSAVIRASYNVSSVTYVSTAVYTINFTSSFADANYCYSAAVRQPANGTAINVSVGHVTYTTDVLAGSLKIQAKRSDTSTSDFDYVGVSVFR